jgi:hypothetical protein
MCRPYRGTRTASPQQAGHAPFVARFQQEIYAEGKGYAAFEYRMRLRCEGEPSVPYEDALWAEIDSMNRSQ